MRPEGLLEVLGVVEAQQLASGGGHGADAGNVGAVVDAAFRIGAHRYGAKGAAVEVLGNTQHEGLIFGDLLGLVAPFACNLDARFDRLGARVHREDHVESEVLRTACLARGPGKRGAVFSRGSRHTSVTNLEKTGKTSL